MFMFRRFGYCLRRSRKQGSSLKNKAAADHRSYRHIGATCKGYILTDEDKEGTTWWTRDNRN